MSMKKKVANALMAMGLLPNLNGFSYITDAVCMVADDISKPAILGFAFQRFCLRRTIFV